MAPKRRRQPLSELQDNSRTSVDTSLPSSLVSSPGAAKVRRPFTKRTRASKIADISYSSSIKSELSDSISSELVEHRKALFCNRRPGKENNLLPDVSYSSLTAVNTENFDDVIHIQKIPKLFKRIKKDGVENRDHTFPTVTPLGLQRNGLDVSYASTSTSCAEDSLGNISTIPNSPFKKPYNRKKPRAENSFNLSYLSNESGGTVTDMDLKVSKKPAMFKKTKDTGVSVNISYNSSLDKTENDSTSNSIDADDVLRDGNLSTQLPHVREGNLTLNGSKGKVMELEPRASLHVSNLTGFEERNPCPTPVAVDSFITPDELNNTSSSRGSQESVRRAARNSSNADDVNISSRTRRQRKISENSNYSQMDTSNESFGKRSSTNQVSERNDSMNSSSLMSQNIAFQTRKLSKSKDDEKIVEVDLNATPISAPSHGGSTLNPASPNDTVNNSLFKVPFGYRFEKTKVNEISYESSLNEKSLNETVGSFRKRHRKMFNNDKNCNAGLSEISYVSSTNESIEQDSLPHTPISCMLTPRDSRKNSMTENSDILQTTYEEFKTQESISKNNDANMEDNVVDDVSQPSERNDSSNVSDGSNLDSSRRVTRKTKNVTQSSDNISFQNELFKRTQNTSHALSSPLYIASQETQTAENCTVEGNPKRKLFNKALNRSGTNFYVTYEESVEDSRENTVEPAESSSKESSDESSHEEESSESESEDEERSVSEEDEANRTEEEVVQETADVDVEMPSKNNFENIPEESLQNEEGISVQIEEGMGLQNEEGMVLDGAAADSRLDLAIGSTEKSQNVSDQSSPHSSQNVTVIPEKPKKTAIDYKALKARIDATIAEIIKNAEEKAKNKRKFEYPVSPVMQKKRTFPRKTLPMKKYPKPKLYKPAHWATKRLYKYLENCLRYEKLNRMLAAEAVVKVMYETVQAVLHSKTYPRDAVQKLKVELASRKIIVTTLDFYSFVRNYLPRYFHEKVIPCLQPFTGQVWPPKDNYPETDPIPF